MLKFFYDNVTPPLFLNPYQAIRISRKKKQDKSVIFTHFRLLATKLFLNRVRIGRVHIVQASFQMDHFRPISDWRLNLECFSDRQIAPSSQSQFDTSIQKKIRSKLSVYWKS